MGSANGFGKQRVLVVDDEKVIATTMAAILAYNGFESQFALSAEDAILLAADFRPDVLLSDLVMPGGKDGIDAIRAIRQFLPGCRAILITGQAGVLPKTAKFEDVRILQKPVPPSELIAILRGHDVPMQPARRVVVLVVDDQEMKRYSAARWLKLNGFEVREAESGMQAVAMAREAIDCVLLDVRLPDMDGFEVCRRLRAGGMPLTPIIHFTAYGGDERIRNESLASGADALVAQPVEPEELAYTVRNYVQRRYLKDDSEAK